MKTKNCDYKGKCGSCIYLDLESHHRGLGYECKNPNITHSHYGHLRLKSQLACKKGYEDKDGNRLKHDLKTMRFSRESLYKHDEDLIYDLEELILDDVSTKHRYDGGTVHGIVMGIVNEFLKTRKEAAELGGEDET